MAAIAGRRLYGGGRGSVPEEVDLRLKGKDDAGNNMQRRNS